ncbi:MAG: hypothetical protein AB7V13_10760 [Pseudorhodoplanes sp.]|uniref:hypothetical protein n=1 Tax=Pseudorhodoplanes sp. TaxID=1934341 RepID=UPI003D09C068
MTLPVWPEDVPYRVRRGDWAMPEAYALPEETQMEGNNIRARARPGSNVAVIEQTLRLTPAEHDDFFAWLREDLTFGTSRFTAQVWLGTAYAEKTCQFVSPHPVPSADRSLKIPVRMRIRVYGV